MKCTPSGSTLFRVESEAKQISWPTSQLTVHSRNDARWYNMPNLRKSGVIEFTAEV